MSRTRPLLPGEYADGARVVETTLRPVRPACLIPENDPGLAVRFAESRSLAWGGHVGYALPYSRSEGLRQPWRRLLDLLDPDKVFALGTSRKPAISPGVVNPCAPQQEPAKPVADRIGDELGRMVYALEEGPEGLFVSASALMHSVLDVVGEDLKPPNSKQFVIVPRVYWKFSSPYLPVIARYGGLNAAELESTLNEVHSHRSRSNLDLSESVRVEKVGGDGDLLGILSGDVSSLLDDGSESALTLPELTLRGLQITGRASPHALYRRSAGGREEGRYRPIVVTGSDDSVEDFALFWNLRSEHHFAKPFPLWIPIDLLEDEQAPAVIEEALGRVQPSVFEPSPRKDDLLIVSASMEATELRDRLRDRYPEARIGADDLIDLFTATCEYRYTTEKLPAQFDRGRASIQPPRPEELNRNFIPQVDYVAYEVGVDGMWLPQGEATARHLGRLNSRDKVSKWGNLRFVRPFNRDFSEKDLIDLRTPDGWTMLRSVFEERGYDIVPSDKGGPALGQLALLGEIANLKVIASSKVRCLLNELCIRRGNRPGRDNRYVVKRKTVPFERFAEEWGDVALEVLRWLIKRRVLFRGAELTCPKCQLSWWYHVDRIGEIWRCDGCQEDLPIPLEVDKTGWQYRINELYAHGHDQGTLTPLLTLYAMHIAWSSQSSRGGLGFYPGVKLKAKEGANVPVPPRKEIDLVAMRGSNLILAECKESTRHLFEPEKASKFARELGDLVQLADYLGASQLLVTSSTAFPDNKDPLLQNVPADPCVELGWLDGHDLLDPYPILHPLSLSSAPSGGTSSKPEGWETEYLDWLRSSIADTTA